ncbi:type II toxin-antitoxin system RelE/ParE family toxin [Flavobacterium sp. IMCC34518]|uniref:type II toxin-antitoxin system RelE/ParE family toxin n=1 Tax=Flavobacterium sp. IMCC34518 TaxID=3003623 RepID=UPI0022AC664E|nr:type II toxin-antitoxin system RelE/ParE family toxin [Flavobacterium sp. IMCC34518]
MVDNRILVWDKLAFDQLKEMYDSLKMGGNLSYANRIKNSVLKTTKELLDNPYIFEQDRFKYDNDGSFRAFVKFKYREAYKITETQIRILRVRHTSREPIEY